MFGCLKTNKTNFRIPAVGRRGRAEASDPLAANRFSGSPRDAFTYSSSRPATGLVTAAVIEHARISRPEALQPPVPAVLDVNGLMAWRQDPEIGARRVAEMEQSLARARAPLLAPRAAVSSSTARPADRAAHGVGWQAA